MLELQALKPVLTALVLPPVPWLLLILFGAWLSGRRRRLGMALLVLGVALVWLSACQGVGRWLQTTLLAVPAPLGPNEVIALKPARAQPSPTTEVKPVHRQGLD